MFFVVFAVVLLVLQSLGGEMLLLFLDFCLGFS